MTQWRIAVVAFGVAFIGVPAAWAQSVPPLVNYQGRLTSQTGAPLAAGPYIIRFRLWNDPTASAPGNLIWSQQQSVTVQTNGAFNVVLGAPAGSPISGDLPAVTNIASAFGSSNVFLGVTIASSNGVAIASPAEVLPRQELLSVPFSVVAQQAQAAQQAQVALGLAPNLASALCPPGSIMAFMGASAPQGWLLCDGSLVSRAQYAGLFSVIGTSSGAGDGSTTFNLPDLRGLFLRGANGSQSNTNYWDPDVSSRTNEFTGGNVGNAVGSLQMDQFAAHTHTFPSGGWMVNPGNPAAAGSGYPSGSYPTSSSGGNETRPKNIYVNYIIKY
jgi:hypothetical protein